MQVKKQYKSKRAQAAPYDARFNSDRRGKPYSTTHANFYQASDQKSDKKYYSGYHKESHFREQQRFDYYRNADMYESYRYESQRGTHGGLGTFNRAQNGWPVAKNTSHVNYRNSKWQDEKTPPPVFVSGNDVCSELLDINAKPNTFDYYPSQLMDNSTHQQYGYLPASRFPPSHQSERPKYPQRFTEKHLIESLNVNAVQPSKPVMFYNMLNQGNKRGKETNVLALDCERVLTNNGEMLARVSVVNFYGNIVFDTLVKPCRYHSEQPNVIDYREWITGIKPIDLEHAPTFGNIEPIIKKIVKDKTIVGHSLRDDFKTLNIDPKEANCSVRDISNINIFMQKIDRDSHSPIKDNEDLSTSLNGSGGMIASKNSSHSLKSDQGGPASNKITTPRKKVFANYVIKKRKLKDLAGEFLNAKIQSGHHSSVIDARAALALYRMNYETIEIQFRLGAAQEELQIQKDKIAQIEQLKEHEIYEYKIDDSVAVKSENISGSLNPQEEDKEEKETSSKEQNLVKKMSTLQLHDRLEGLNLAQNMLDSQNNQSLKDIQFLINNKTEIFNVTPPNAKDEDKAKFQGKYRLLQQNQNNKEWKGFTPSKIENGNRHQNSNSNKGSTFSSIRYSNDRRLHERFGFDPFNHDWSSSSRKHGGPPSSAHQMSQKEEMMQMRSPSQPQLSFEQTSGFNSTLQKRGKNGGGGTENKAYYQGYNKQSVKDNIQISKFQLD